MSGQTVERLARRLEDISGDEHVLRHRHALRTYGSDGLLHHARPPAVAILPGSGAEVHAAVKACVDAGVPWVARGAGTGLSGGALPIEEGVLIVTSRLRKILEIDLDDGRVVAEPAVTNAAVTRAVAPTHFFPPDPSSQIVCSVGGNVAENSGGAHCFKYGFTTHYVTGMEVVLADGSMTWLGGRHADELGPDLVGAFVGSEGTLGICTRAVLRVVPAPEDVRTFVAFFPSTTEAGNAVSEIVSSGVVPGAIEMMDRLAIQAAEDATNAGYDRTAGAALVVEIDGPLAECDAAFDAVAAMCRDAGATDVRIAADEAERALIWRARKAAFAAMGRVSPSYYVQDGVIPRTKLAAVLARIEELAGEYGLRVANVFHAGDGNLHPLICYDPAVEGEAERAERLAGDILRTCVESGGSITGEHGVGVDKRDYMPWMFAEPDLEAFARLRRAFDPSGLANPDKVLPTPRLCGEVPGPYRQHPLEAQGVIERW